MSTVADYVGRTVDVAAFQGWELGIGVDALLDQTIATPQNSGEIVTGILKVTQRFLMRLFTEQGSLQYKPDEGCRFMQDARQGKWRTPADITASYHFSLVDVRQQFAQEITAADPPEDRFNDAVLLGVSLSPVDQAKLRILISTDAGEQRAFIAPLRISNG